MNPAFEKDIDAEVFYGPLPIAEPYAIPKPSKAVSIQPTVAPIAITPYISFESDEEKPSPNIEEAPLEAAKPAKKGKTRFAGFFIFLISIVCITPFIMSFYANFPIASLEKYFRLLNLLDSWKLIVENGAYKPDAVSIPVYLSSVGILALTINGLKGLVALFTGNRKGYIFFGFVAMVVFVVQGLYVFGFSKLAQIATIFSQPECVVYISIGLLSFISALIMTLICPKVRNLELTEF